MENYCRKCTALLNRDLKYKEFCLNNEDRLEEKNQFVSLGLALNDIYQHCARECYLRRNSNKDELEDKEMVKARQIEKIQ